MDVSIVVAVVSWTAELGPMELLVGGWLALLETTMAASAEMTPKVRFICHGITIMLMSSHTVICAGCALNYHQIY